MLHKLITHVYVVVLLVAVSHSGHQDSPVRGIVICYTKFYLLLLLTVANRIHLSEGL
jgi:hypothetical protein